jgi:hypothetical protein
MSSRWWIGMQICQASKVLDCNEHVIALVIQREDLPSE